MSGIAQQNNDTDKIQKLSFEQIEKALNGIYSEDRIHLKVKLENKKNQNSKRDYRYIIQIKIDGTWAKILDENSRFIIENNTIKRDFLYESEINIKRTESLVKDIIGFEEGDIISVEAAKFDRSEEFELEDQSYIDRSKKMVFNWKHIIIITLILILVASIFIYRRKR